ncbi:MAG TPA: hypothetical protein VMH35_17505 [Streptosporangiaceae bacterium]|nr:hypothetical protein [Streptosporangiaceae bacterium]
MTTVQPQLDRPARTAAPARRRWLAGAAWAGATLLVFMCYWRVSRTEPGDSYGAVFTLQAWDMLHGNLLLHDWWLSDVSFYTTELPEYLLVELVLGRSPDVVHVAGAITFTLVLLLAVALARGRATGRAAAVRMAIAAGLMCSPQPGAGVFLFLLAPDHYGSTVPVLLAWLILDRAAPRWYVPPAVGVLLGWALVADSIVLLTAVLPLVMVCAVRLYHRAVQQRQPLRGPWFDAALLAAGLTAAAVTAATVHLIGAAGGFRLNPVSSQLTSVGALPGHLYQTVTGLTLVFGGDFLGQPVRLAAVLLLLHLAGLALVGWAVGAGLHRLRDTDLVSQLLLAGILVNLAAFGVWTDVTSVSTTREIVAVLPFGAVLAARLLADRLLADRLAAARLRPALAAVGCGYLVSLGVLLAHPPVPPQAQRLTSWLEAHHLRYGLGNSALGSVVTVSSEGRVALRPLRMDRHRLAPGHWEAEQSWFGPRQHDATFAALLGTPPAPPLADFRLAFGPPAAIYHIGRYTVLTWDRENLLTRLR